jgi:glycosyltransferase involved in cell wall biosynthesis
MLLLVSRLFGGPYGANQSAFDALIALGATNKVDVLSSQGNKLKSQQIDGYMPKLRKWITILDERVEFPLRLDQQFPHVLATWLLQSLSNLRQSNRLRGIQPKLTFVNGLGSHEYLSKVELSIGGKKVLIVRESPRHFREPAPMSVDWALGAMTEYSGFIFVSANCQEEWLTIGPFKGKRSYYVPNCCREHVVKNLVSQDRSKVRQRLGISEDKFVVVCVASLQPRKGQDLLVDLFPDLLAVTSNLKMYLVGPTSAMAPEWAAAQLNKVQSSGFNKNLEYVGSRADAMDFIYAADIFVLPSRAEAMPRVILEAMALKKPVIASNVDGIPELIEHEKEGLLFSPGQPQGFMEAFKRMVTEPNTRKLFAERAQKKYWSKFSRAHQIRRYGAIIQEMMQA